jgi:hypothetical protein
MNGAAQWMGAPDIWCDSFVGKAFLGNVALALWITARVQAAIATFNGSHAEQKPLRWDIRN